jgi:hypothetical protein
VILWRQLPEREHAQVEAHLDEEQRGTRHVGMLEQTPLVALALGAVVLGVLALPPFGDTVARALGEEPLHPTPLEMAASVVVALGVLALVWWRPVPEPGWALAWLGLERATQALVVRPTLALAEALARFDDRVLDRGVAGSTGRSRQRPGRRCGPRLARHGTTTGGSMGRSRGSLRSCAASAGSHVVRRPASCTSTTSRPSRCSRSASCSLSR